MDARRGHRVGLSHFSSLPSSQHGGIMDRGRLLRGGSRAGAPRIPRRPARRHSPGFHRREACPRLESIGNATNPQKSKLSPAHRRSAKNKPMRRTTSSRSKAPIRRAVGPGGRVRRACRRPWVKPAAGAHGRRRRSTGAQRPPRPFDQLAAAFCETEPIKLQREPKRRTASTNAFHAARPLARAKTNNAYRDVPLEMHPGRQKERRRRSAPGA